MRLYEIYWLLGILYLLPTHSYSQDLDKIAIQWTPYVEWNIPNSSYSGNPFDIIADVTFTHQITADTITTGMFYNGSDEWNFRFTGTKLGNWDFVSFSSDSVLNGLTGTVTVNANPDSNAAGFITNFGNKWGWLGLDEAFVPQFVAYDGPNLYYNDPGKIDTDIQTYFEEHGFNGLHTQVNCRWFDIDEVAYDSIENPNPDIQTFEALELLITKVHAAGGAVHIWAWGDEARRWTPVKWGINGPEDQRLQRYIAARLGPLPGWTMGYGFDVDEWVIEEDLEGWHTYMQANLGWKHFLGARDGGPNNPGEPFNQIYEGLDYSSYEQHHPDYDRYVETIEARPSKPSFSEDRFRIRQLKPKDYTMEEVRRGLWHSTMAGGIANIWANDSAATFPNTEWIKTYSDFFKGRFKKDLERDNTLTDGVCLKRPTGEHFLFYKEDASSIQLNLSAITDSVMAVAVDALLPYAEIPLGNLNNTNQVWTAPYQSDWAIAVAPIPINPTLSLLSPNGGENWQDGSLQTIAWLATDITNIDIAYRTSPLGQWVTVAEDVIATTGLYNWTVPNSPTSEAMVKISDSQNSALADSSDGDFTITSGIPPEAIASASVTSGDVPLDVDFTGSTSIDFDDTIVSYQWDFSDGNSANTADTSHTYTASGTYNVVLTVTDNGANSDTAQITITVTNPANTPPTAVASASVTSGEAPLDVDFTGSASTDSDGSIISYDWDFNDGNSANTANPSHTYTTAGIYNASLIVTDNDSDSDTTQITITITAPPNIPPTAVASASVTSGETPLDVDFTGSTSTDSDGSIVSYDWDFNDGNSVNTANPSHTYTTAGVYNASLIVTDNDSDSDTAQITITVTAPPNIPPTAIASASVTSGEAPLAVFLTGSDSIDSDGSIISYSWNFDDGNSANTANLSHTYTTAGTYNATLTVTDDDGDTDSENITIIVNSSAPPAGQVLHLALNEGSGFTISDDSGNNNNGTVHDNPVWINGNEGSALQFDGSNDYVTVPDDPSISNLSAVTVSVWIMVDAWLDANDTDAMILSKGNWANNREYRIEYEEDAAGGSGGLIWFVSTNGTGSGAEAIIPVSDITPNNWHNLVGTWDSATSELEFYLDGVLKDNVTRSGSATFNGSGALGIGSSGDNGASGGRDNFDGAIDDVSIFNRALTDQEIIALYNGNSEPVNQAPLVNAGNDQTITFPTNSVSLNGSVSDDELPQGFTLSINWSQIGGPAGQASFANSSQAQTTASFATIGDYVLRLSADDGEYITTDDISITVQPEPIPSITVLNPNGGESWQVGTDQAITWSAVNINNVDISYRTSASGSWINIVQNVAAVSGSYNWTVPATPTNEARIRIVDSQNSSVSDVSDGDFSLATVLSIPFHTYLTWQGNTSTTITINYHTEEPGNSQVYYDTVPRNGQINNYASQANGSSHKIPGLDAFDVRTIHTVELTGLTGGQTYYFIAGNPISGFTQEMQFKTIPNDGSALKFISAGDMGITSSTRDIMTEAAQTDPMFAMVGGDIAYVDGALSSWQIWDTWIDNWEELMVTSEGNMIPMVLAIGNHEVDGGYGKPNDEAPFYYGYFAQEADKAYFSRKFGQNTIVYVMDTNHTASIDGPQKTWLANEMPLNSALPNQIALYHVPLYPGHRSFNGVESSAGRTHWAPIFDDNNLDVAFENHDHVMKRTKLLKGNQVDPTGTLYLGDGCFGVEPRAGDQAGQFYIDKVESKYHFWLVETPSSQNQSQGITFSAIDENGTAFDVYQLVPETASVTLLTPNGGEDWIEGTNQNITWNAVLVDNIDLAYRTSPAAQWNTIAQDIPAASGSYNWTIPSTPTSQARIQITDSQNASVSDSSDSDFIISEAPSITVVSPNGGESWQDGTTQNITWNFTNVSNVDISYRTSASASWTTIVPNIAAASGTYAWTIPNTPTTEARVRIVDSQNSSLSDISNADFAIIGTPSLTLTSPNGGENWQQGSSQNITWNAFLVNDIDIAYRTSSSGQWNDVVQNVSASSGSYLWIIPNTPTTEANIRITDSQNSSILDISDADFSISDEQTSLGEGLVLHIPFDEGTGFIVADASVNNNNGTLQNNPQWVTGYQGSALQFDGSNDYVTVPDDPSISNLNAVTVSAWIMVDAWLDANDTDAMILSKGNWANNREYRIEYEEDAAGGSGGLIWFVSTNGTGSGAEAIIPVSDITPNNWHNLVGTWDSATSELKFYLDGVLKDNVTRSGSATFNGSSGLGIGASADNGASGGRDNFDGAIDEVKVWDRVLSDQEISAVFGGGSDPINQPPQVSAGNNQTITLPTNSVTLNGSVSDDGLPQGSGLSINWSQVGGSAGQVNFANNNQPQTTATFSTTGTFLLRLSGDDSEFIVTDDVSITVQAAPIPEITVLSPNGGESWRESTTQNVTWAATNISNVDIAYRTSPSGQWTSIASNINATQAFFEWTIPGDLTTEGSIRISSAASSAIADNSNADFSIVPNNITDVGRVMPLGNSITNGDNGGYEIFTAGLFDDNGIVFDFVGSLNFGMSFDGDHEGHDGFRADQILANLNTYLTNSPPDVIFLHIGTNDINALQTTSSTAAEIGQILDLIKAFNPNTITLLASLVPRTDSLNDTTDALNVRIKALATQRNQNGDNVIYTAMNEAFVANPNWALEYYPADDWLHPNTDGNEVMGNVWYAAILDALDGVPPAAITVLSPNGGQSWPAGSTQNITWSATSVNNIDIEYRTSPAGLWIPIAQDISASSENYSWDVPNTATAQARIQIKDSQNASVTDVSDADFSITSTNTPPTAIAAASVTSGEVPLNVVFTGSGSSDSDGTIASYLWEFGDSNSANTADTSHIYTVAGTYNAILTVTDDDGESDSDTITVTVNPGATPQLTVLTPNGGENWQAGSTQNITFEGFLVNNIDISYRTSPSGSWVIIAQNVPEAGSFSWTVPNLSTNQARIQITDSENASVVDIGDADFSITSTNTPPTAIAAASVTTGEVPLNVVFTGSGSSDSDGTIASYLWEFGDSNSANTADTSHTYTVAGTYNAILTVTDDDGASDSDTITVTVNPASTPQLTVLTPNGGENWQAGSTQNITFEGFLVNNIDISYRTSPSGSWVIIAQNVPEAGSFSWTVPNVSTNQARIQITDSENASMVDISDADFSITSTNTPPTAIAAASVTSGEVPLNVVFTGSGSSDSDGTIASYLWEFGDSNSANTADTSHIYTVAGTYNAILTVTDDDGASDSDTITVTVNPASTPELTVLTPNGGENWQAGSTQNITFEGFLVNNIDISYRTSPLGSWLIIAQDVPETGSFSWTVPNALTTQARIQITDSENASVVDISDADFSINESPPTGDGLVLHLSFNEGSGSSITDDSGNNNNGTIQDNPQWITGHEGSALLYDGSNDYVTIPSSTSLSNLNAVTVSVWIFVDAWLDAKNTDAMILSKGNWSSAREYRIEYEEDAAGGSGGLIWFISTNGSGSGPEAIIPVSDISPGGWHHLAGTWDSDTDELKFYLDGQLKDNVSSPGNATYDGSGSFGVGASGDNGASGDRDNFDGAIDEISVWNRALSASEITDLASFSGGPDPALQNNVLAKDNATETILTQEVPEQYNLAQNYPNPFNPETVIQFQVKEPTNVNIQIYNAQGQKIRTLVNSIHQTGYFQVVWDGRDQNGNQVASGLYIYEMTTNQFIKRKKMSLIR